MPERLTRLIAIARSEIEPNLRFFLTSRQPLVWLLALAIGLLVFIIYFNLMSAGKAWLEQGTVSPLVGIWWVHGLMISVALILLSMQNGVHRRLFSTGRRS